MRLNLIALLFDRKELLARFWQSTLQVWRHHKAKAIGLAVFLVGILLLQLTTQVLLNLWNRNFFDALGRKDAHQLWIQSQLFIPLAMASVFLAAASVWGRMTAQRSWREALSRHIMEKWLKNDHLLRLNHLRKGAENPEYRIAWDARIATDTPVDFTLALLSSILTSITFFGVLWSVGGSLAVVLFGVTITIPGYLVFGVIIYSGVVSGLMILFGRNLTSVSERMNQSEAEFRAVIDSVTEKTQALESGTRDNDHWQALQLKLQAVLLWWREYCWQLVRTTIVSQGNFLFAPVVAWILCVPKYLSGAMSLGEVTQSAAAFVVVQGAFNWLVDNFQRFADWQSSAHRVATLLLALDELEANQRTETVRQDDAKPT